MDSPTRGTHSAGYAALPLQASSPYREQRPATTMVSSTVSNPERSGLLWKDLIMGAKKRKALIKRLQQAALESSTPIPTLKKALLDLRTLTLTLIEDALEIEYRSRLDGSKMSANSIKNSKLPPITSYKAMNDKEDIYILVDMIGDVDDLFTIPNIRVMLPVQFPANRNPFMMGKTIDDLANINPPHPEAGNAEEELKVLELLRYKRASRALVRAESQLMNKLPIELHDTEKLITKMTDDLNIERLVRSVCAIIDNDRISPHKEADMTCLTRPTFSIEAYELLNRLNTFRGSSPVRIDVQMAVRQALRDCLFDYLDDEASKFLLEWIDIVFRNASDSSVHEKFSSAPPSRFGRNSLQTISEGFLEHGPRSPSQEPSLLVNRNGLDGDLISEVGSKGYIKTHENIHVEEKPRLKSRGESRGKSREGEQRAKSSESAVRPKPDRTHVSKSLDMALGKEYLSDDDESQKHLEASDDESTIASSIGPSPKRRPLKVKAPKDPNAEDPKLAPISMKRKLRAEVEKVMKEMGYGRRLVTDDTNQSSFDTLTSVRYELNKMQQELLRRQVLDPRHYAINSVDAITHVNHGFTVADINAFEATQKGQQPAIDSRPTAPVLVSQRSFVAQIRGGELKLQLSIILDYAEKCLICSVSTTKEEAFLHKLIRDLPMVGAEPLDTPMELSHFIISRLMFSRITECTFDEFVDSRPNARQQMLLNIYQYLEEMASEEPVPRGLQIVKANKVLFTYQISENQVLAELVVSRTDECDGLMLRVTPIAGAFSTKTNNVGPIILIVSDNELEVLLINQHALFEQGMRKWGSMELIAQWLARRIRIQRIFAGSTMNNTGTGRLSQSQRNRPISGRSDDEHSLSSQVTFTARSNEPEDFGLSGFLGTAASTGKQENRSNSLVVIEVKIERQIEISSATIDYWKSRNIPRLAGMQIYLSAYQDLDVMIFNIKLVIPSKSAYRKMIVLASKHGTGKGAGDDGGLVDMEAYSDDEKYDNNDNGDPSDINLSYRLTRAELLTFGANPLIENKKISISRKKSSSDDDHPENMVWNVLSRLRVDFKGSKKNPYNEELSALDQSNWSIVYDRKLLREVKTISGFVIMVTTSVIGCDLLLDAEHVDTNLAKGPIGSKRISEDEVREFVYSEGLALSFLEYPRRKDTGSKILDKLKIVHENESDRLELYTYVESKMIIITRVAVGYDPEEELGVVEINSHHTLSDLRILMKHELEIELLPVQFRFLYKGMPCSLRQEAFRRAWECLPCCYITPKAVASQESGTETDDIAHKRATLGAKKPAAPTIPRLGKGQRRAPGRLVPVPLQSLCIVQEGKFHVYFLHEVQNMLVPGDVIRIGDVSGRDYIVMSVGHRSENGDSNWTVIEIDPEYDLLGEPDFNKPIQGNFTWPTKNAGMYLKDYTQRVRLLKTPDEMGFDYNMPDLMPSTDAMEVTAASTMADGLEGSANPLMMTTGVGTSVEDDLLSLASSLSGGTAENSVLRNSRAKKQEKVGRRKFSNCWIWKCIPAKDDSRPKWKQMYDDGEVHYSYELANSEDYATHFRVKAWFSYLEVLCTDARIPSLTIHNQRVNEMRNIPIEFYTNFIFESMTDWNPVYKRGVERSKFIKLMKDVAAFPDLKRPARVQQLDMYFAKMVKSEFGIVQKYINYQGFCQLLKTVALIRYPPKRRIQELEQEEKQSVTQKTTAAAELRANEVKAEKEKRDKNNGKQTKPKKNKQANDDDSSVGSLNDDLDSIGSIGSNDGGDEKDKKRKGDKDSNNSSNNKKDSKKKKKKHATSEELLLSSADPQHIEYAYQKFILDYLMTFPTWYDTPWREAKLAAIRKEAITYCAATRIAAVYRGRLAARDYNFFIRQHIKLQAQIRRRLSAKRTRYLISQLHEDWCFRMRYHYATMIQALCRRFLKRCWYEKVLEGIRRQQVALLKARRQKLKKLRESSKKKQIYGEAKRISGVMVFIKVMRKDPRNYTKDFGIIIEVYVPYSQEKFTFIVDDSELREYMVLLLELPVVATGQLLDKNNLRKLISVRLIVKKVNKAGASPIITFSKHALGQRGEKAMTCAKRIQGEMFICKIFVTVEDISIQMYHRLTCKIFTCTMEMNDCKKWVLEDLEMTIPAHIAHSHASGATNKDSKPLLAIANGEASSEREGSLENMVSSEEVVDSTPSLLHPSNKLSFYDWLLNHLVIDTRKKQFKVVWSNQYEKSRKREMVIRIQSVWRRSLNRPKIVRKLDAFMLKVQVSAFDHTIYYLNRLTGASSWDKPRLLGPTADLTEQPTRKWVPLMFEDSEGNRVQHFVNPYSGKYTSLTPDQGARKLQAFVRNYLLKLLRMPHAHLIAAGKIVKNAEKAYNETIPRRLAQVINMALFTHAIKLEEIESKQYYREAVELSEANPLVTRAYGFFLISSCEAPVQLNRERALILLSDGRRRDPQDLKFVTAYYVFQFACLMHPNDYRALCNLAIVQALMYNLNFTAEKLLRRALALAPFEERVMEIWNYLKDRFTEKQMVYNPRSRVNFVKRDPKNPKPRRVVHGRPVDEDSQWAGWLFVEKDEFKVSKIHAGVSYWYNPADGTEQIEPPDFKVQWVIRKSRSHYQGDDFGLESYYDPLTAQYFNYHPLTDSYK